MTDTAASYADRLYASPVQIIRTDDGAIVRRGTVRLHVRGESAADILMEIIQAASRPNGALAAEIVGLHDERLHPAILDLVDALLARRLLVNLQRNGEEFLARNTSEQREDVFFWTFGGDADEIRRALATHRVAVIGVNAVSQTLVSVLAQSGLGEVKAVDHPMLRSMRYCDAAGNVNPKLWLQDPPVAYEDWVHTGELPDCLVTTSDFGGLSLMREWNRFCVESGSAFYAAVLQDMTGFAGPFVVPGKTACFECFWLRQNSNFEGGAKHRESEDVSFQGQIVDGMLPSMAAVLGQVAAFEIHRYYAGHPPGIRMSTVIEIDMIGSTMTPRKLLRAPRCPACGSGRKHARISIEQTESASSDTRQA